MGKARATRHQKFVKSEKNKTKLKDDKKKKEIKSDTQFKIKKIIVREQTIVTSAPKEFNTLVQVLKGGSGSDQRFAAVSVLRNESASNLAPTQLLSLIVPLILDVEKSIRKEAYQAIRTVLKPLNKDGVAPSSEILISHLQCAMTHISTTIHEDSLIYFDVLLECAPSLLISSINKIFPSFIDMISKLQTNSKPGRTLSVNLGSKMTSVQWRMKVLTRLSKFLRLITQSKIDLDGDVTDDSNSKSIDSITRIYNKDKRSYYPLYDPIIIRKINFNETKTVIQDNDVANYVNILTPLLFDAWLEVRPTNHNERSKIDSTISGAGAVILENILDILLHMSYIIQIADKKSHSNESMKKFTQKYRQIYTQLIFNSFPYNQSERKSPDVQAHITLNLKVCHIFVMLGQFVNDSPCNKIWQPVDYIKETLDSISTSEAEAQVFEIISVMLKYKDAISSMVLLSLLDKLISIYQSTTNERFKKNIFTLFCEMYLDNDAESLQSMGSFKSWLSTLPDMICNERNVPSKTLQVIIKFAIRHNKLFNTCIKPKFKQLIDNLPNLDIADVSDKFEAKKRVVGILYWVNCWDTESLNILQDQLASNVYDVDIKEYLVDILKLKTDGLFSNRLNNSTE